MRWYIVRRALVKDEFAGRLVPVAFEFSSWALWLATR